MRCPACDTENLVPARGRIAFCGDCGHRWYLTSVESHHQVEIDVYTQDYSGYVPDSVFVERAGAFVKNQLGPHLTPSASMLDVGCGAGEFMTVVRNLGYDIEGIDISEASAAICRKKGLKARAANFLTEPFDRKFDMITMWDVTEHLLDPEAFFRRAGEMLSERGVFMAKVPVWGDISVRISNAVPRTAGELLGAPDHVQYFDRESLGRLLDRTGFSVEWLRPEQPDIRAAKTGGSIKRRISRKLRKLARVISGDTNLYFVARRA